MLLIGTALIFIAKQSLVRECLISLYQANVILKSEGMQLVPNWSALTEINLCATRYTTALLCYPIAHIGICATYITSLLASLYRDIFDISYYALIED